MNLRPADFPPAHDNSISSAGKMLYGITIVTLFLILLIFPENASINPVFIAAFLWLL